MGKESDKRLHRYPCIIEGVSDNPLFEKVWEFCEKQNPEIPMAPKSLSRSRNTAPEPVTLQSCSIRPAKSGLG
jgi:hypothetical protein